MNGFFSRRVSVVSLFVAAMLAAPHNGRSTEKARVIVPEFGMSHIPVYVARERGFFKEAGIEVEIVRAPANIGIHALIASEADFLAAGNIPIRARLLGAPIKVVGVTLGRSLYWLYAAPKFHSVTALRGATIGVDAIGSILNATTNTVLERHRLKPSDIIYRGLGGSSLRLQALRRGLIDATILSSPYNFFARNEGYVELSFYANEVPLTGAQISTTYKTIKERPDLVRRFIIGVLQANLFVRTRRSETISLLRKWTGIEDDLARETYGTAAPFFSETGIQDQSSMVADVEIQRRAFKIRANLPLDQIFDFSFAKEAGEAIKSTGGSPR
jgi:ABC-type nitrate/sulfonate/bicarbonate transport system substrate-binding protein